MKDLIVLSTPEEINTYVFNLWRTPEFKENHRNNGFIGHLVRKFSQYPKAFFEMSDPQIETAHFSTWWGAIAKRTYESPELNDLFYLHEIAHAANMIFYPDMTFANWKQKMVDNELQASVISELVVHLEFGPEFRKRTFEHTILVDQFLNDPTFVNFYRSSPKTAYQELMLRRRNIMTNPMPKNLVEFWIQRFANQNDAWAACWSFRYDEVERKMYEIQTLSRNGKTDQALDVYKKWLTSATVLFVDEAQAFAGVYWAAKQFYLDSLKQSCS